MCVLHGSLQRAAYYISSFLLWFCCRTVPKFSMLLLLQTLAFLLVTFFLSYGLVILLIFTVLLLLLFRLRTFHSLCPVKHQKSPFGHHIDPFSLFHYLLSFIFIILIATFHSYKVFCQYWSPLSRGQEPQMVWLILKQNTLLNKFAPCLWESNILIEIKAEALSLFHNSCLFYWKWSLI